MSPPTIRGALALSHELPPLMSVRADLELSPIDVSAAVMPCSRGFPTPPTGHELMALFPPPPPPIPTMGSTSNLFFAQERAFFARKGKEIIAVQIEADLYAGPSQPYPHAHTHPHSHPQPPDPVPAEQTVRQMSRALRTHPVGTRSPRLRAPSPDRRRCRGAQVRARPIRLLAVEDTQAHPTQSDERLTYSTV